MGNITYTNVTVTSKTASEIFIVHQSGVANLKLKNLDAKLQKQFGYDADQDAALEKKQAEAMTLYKSSLVKPSSEKISTNETAAASGKKIWAKSFLNQKSPPFLIEKWLSAAPPDTSGKFLLVDFWATWCPPCRKAIPELNLFHQKFGKKLIVIGLSDEPEETVRAMTEPVIHYFSAIDTLSRTKKAVEVKGIPHVLLIDPNGIVRWEGFPFLDGNELTEDVIRDIIEKFSP
ncbi:MAG: TlpA disulfide reductase family protein [Verrucomicrobiota bacterium]